MVDARESPALVKRFDVTNTPQIRLVDHDVANDKFHMQKFEGYYQVSNIMSWTLRTVNDGKAVRLRDETSVATFVSLLDQDNGGNLVVVVGFFAQKDKAARKLYRKVMSGMETVIWGTAGTRAVRCLCVSGGAAARVSILA